MPRILRTDPLPRVVLPADKLVVTLDPAVAGKLGVPYFSLKRLARIALRREGLSICTAAQSRKTLRQAVANVAAAHGIISSAARIRGAVADVIRTGVDVDLMIKHGGPRVREVALVAKEYRRRLLAHRQIDGNELLWRAAHSAPAKRQIIVYGHFRARFEEINFINAIADEGSEFILPINDLDPIFSVNRRAADWLVKAGWNEVSSVAAPFDRDVGEVLADTFAGEPGFNVGVTALRYPDVETEVRATLAKIKQNILDGAKPDEIAIVSRDPDTYAGIISSVAAEYGLPVLIRHGISVEATSVGGFIGLLLDAVANDFPFETTARLLRHPFGPGLDEGKWQESRGRRPSGKTEWLTFNPLLDKLIAPEGTRTVPEWANYIRTLLKTLEVRDRCAFRTREIQAFNAFMDGLSETVEVEGERAVELAEFQMLVKEILSETRVQFQPNLVGVRVRQPKDLLGAKFNQLFVIGMAEGMLPAEVRDDPVIDFFERAGLRESGIHFDSAADISRWEALAFYFMLLAGRSEFTFSYPAVVDGREQVASPYFDRLRIKPIRAGADSITVSSLEEAVTRVLRSDAVIAELGPLDDVRTRYNVELRREGTGVADEHDGVVGLRFDPASITWSASQISTIGQCGFRWFAARLLGLRAIPEPLLGMDYTKRGTFYHKVLQLAMEKAKDAEDIRSAALAHLDDAFAAAESEMGNDLPTRSNWELQRADHLRILRKAILSKDFITDGARVLALEKEFNTVWKGWRLRGTIDRIDETEYGLLAVDYKASSNPPKGAKDDGGKLSIDVQIPIYSEAGLPALYPNHPVGKSYYYSLTKGKLLNKRKPTDGEGLLALLRRIGSMLEKGNYAVSPDVKNEACEYCDFDLLCRRGPRLDNKGKDA